MLLTHYIAPVALMGLAVSAIPTNGQDESKAAIPDPSADCLPIKSITRNPYTSLESPIWTMAAVRHIPTKAAVQHIPTKAADLAKPLHLKARHDPARYQEIVEGYKTHLRKLWVKYQGNQASGKGAKKIAKKARKIKRKMEKWIWKLKQSGYHIESEPEFTPVAALFNIAPNPTETIGATAAPATSTTLARVTGS